MSEKVINFYVLILHSFLWSLDFVEVWQELEFWKVLNGRKIEHDRAEFIEEIYQITVRFLDDPLNGEVRLIVLLRPLQFVNFIFSMNRQ